MTRLILLVVSTLAISCKLSTAQSIYAVPNPPGWPVIMTALIPPEMKLANPTFAWKFPTAGTPNPRCTVNGAAKTACNGKVLDFVFPTAGIHKIELSISDSSLPTPKVVTLDIDIVPIEQFPVVKRAEVRQVDASTWDRFVQALYILKETGIFDHLGKIHELSFNNNRDSNSRRSCAHSGPGFLPWHRIQTRVTERAIQHAIGDPTMGMPYWDWEKGWDGMEKYFGGNGNPAKEWVVDSGPFCGDPSATDATRCPKKWRLPDSYPHKDKALQRQLGNDSSFTFPTSQIMQRIISLPTYDVAPFNDQSPSTSFRTALEGWAASTNGDTSLGFGHNGMHRWISGTMRMVELSFYDPLFFAVHGGVERYYTLWQTTHGCTDGNASAKCYNPSAGDNVPGMMSSDRAYPWDMPYAEGLKANQGYVYLNTNEKPPPPNDGGVNIPDPSKGNTTTSPFQNSAKSQPSASRAFLSAALVMVAVVLTV